MKHTLQEIFAVIIITAVLFGLPVVIFQNGPWVSAANTPVIHLTGVMKSGVWTNQEVNGLNYWWETFHPATITLREDEEVILRLTSSDGTHSFYIPELDIGPIQVEAGYTQDVLLRANRAGVFTYYCITVCGDCHYFMQGTIIVEADAKELATSEANRDNSICSLHEQQDEFTSFVDRGKYLYTRTGCATCHGEEGKGGVYNVNYVSGFIPQLDNLADKMKVYWEEDADIIVQLLETEPNLLRLEDDPPIENYNRFIAQYLSIQNKIINGSPSIQKLDPNGPEPPLKMPAWEEQLSTEDINSILAYLITLFPWEEYE